MKRTYSHFYGLRAVHVLHTNRVRWRKAATHRGARVLLRKKTDQTLED